MAEVSNNVTFFEEHRTTTFSYDHTTSYTNTTKANLVTNIIASSDDRLVPGLTTVYVIISVVGIVGNLFCLVVLLGHAPLRRKPANYFLISQSIIDLLVSILLPLNTSINVPIIGRPFDDILCYMWTSRSIFLGLFTASLFNITALAVERYFKIAHPLLHRIWMTRNRLLWIVVGVSVAGILLKMPYSMGGTYFDQDGTCVVEEYPTETIDVVVGVYNFLVEYFLPLLIIAFCYIQMARSLRINIRPPVTAESSRESTMARARLNILKTLLVVVMIFVACTTFKQTLLLSKAIGDVPLDYLGLTFNASQVMSFMVCCTNPFIYILHYEAFKVGMRTLFTRRFNSIRPEIVPEAALGEETV